MTTLATCQVERGCYQGATVVCHACGKLACDSHADASRPYCLVCACTEDEREQEMAELMVAEQELRDAELQNERRSDA